jgi:hypothetical protein
MVERSSTVNVNDIKAKFSTKRDLYFFMAFELGAYLPKEKTVTIYFLKQLISGERLVSESPSDKSKLVHKIGASCSNSSTLIQRSSSKRFHRSLRSI